MNESAFGLERLEKLRRSFDLSFAEPPPVETEQVEDLLIIRVGGDEYAVRFNEAAGLYVDRRVVRMPTPMPELLGIAGFRGSVIPVFDLSALLGYGPAADHSGRWLLLAGKDELVGLAFEAFTGHFRVLRRDLVRQDGSERLRQHVLEVVRVGDHIRAVISVASVLGAIKRRVLDAAPLEGA
jgi:purine-binding chemotaxis protein CheW